MNFDRNPTKVQIFDTTNRDGEQATEGALYGIESKLIIAQELAKAGVDRIEAGFPASSKNDFEAVQQIAREVQGPIIFGLARVPIEECKVSFKDIDVAYEAVRDAENRGIHTFSIMFDRTSLKKYGCSRQQVVEGAVKGVSHARGLLGDRGQVEFSFQNAASAPREWVIDGYRKVVEAGADVINVPDTNGTRTPDEIKEIITDLRRDLPAYVLISIHAHNDLGLAVANSLAAVQAGADIVEGTVNGIGERSGNTALEEVIVNIFHRPELYGNRRTNVDLHKLNHLSALVAEHYGLPVPDHKAIVGANAFRHRSGIHQDGVIKEVAYEFIHPEIVGWEGEKFGLTARSGTAGVGARLKRLGYSLDPEVVKFEIMPLYKDLADSKRHITDADLVSLMDLVNRAGTVTSLELHKVKRMS
ncbi:MAG: 2-isopropylmalate synthase [Candidatus Altiarchaeota archaeon]